MTITWILTALSLLLLSLLLMATGRLLPSIFNRYYKVILFLISFVVCFGILSSQWGANFFYASFFFATAISAGLFDLTFGFCLYLALILFRPWEMWPSDLIFNLIPRLGALYTLGFMAITFLQEKVWRLHKMSWMLIAFFAWTIFCTIRFGFSSNLLITNAHLFFPSIVLFVLIQFWIRDNDDYRLVTNTISLGIFIIAALSLITYVRFNGDQGRIESMGMLSNSNDIAALCVLALPLILWPFIQFRKYQFSFMHLINLLMTIPLLAVIYYSQSRGAVLGFVVILGALFTLKVKIKWYMVIAFLVFTYGLITFVAQQRESEDIAQSTSSRLGYWKTSMMMMVKNPIMGVGMNRYPIEFENYSSNHQYEFGQRTAHSSWFLVLAETGLPGFVLFISLFIYTLKETFKISRIHPELFLALIGYTVTMTFLSHSYLFYPYMLIGLCLAMIRVARKESAA